jgi:hypothetical protein
VVSRWGVVAVVLMTAACTGDPSGAPAHPPGGPETTSSAAATTPVPETTRQVVTTSPSTVTTSSTTTTIAAATTTTAVTATTTGPGDSDRPEAPPGPEITVAERPAVPALRSVTAEAPLRVWVIGDSLAGPLGGALRQTVAGQLPVDVIIDYAGGTGLARPDLFDWPERIASRLPEVAPDAVVFHVGANDAQQVRTEGGWAQFGTPEWIEAYRNVVGAAMDQIRAGAARVYWVGAPIMAGPGFTESIVVINRIFEEEAAGRPGVTYVDAFGVFQDDEGRYAATLPGPDGSPIRVRDSDGVHYTAAGAARLAGHVLEILVGEWGLASDGD